MADTQVKTYIETGVMPIQSSLTRATDSYTYVGDHRDFFEDLTTHEMIGYYDSGEGGNCGYIAAGLVLLYYDYFHNDNFINDTTYLSSSGNAFKGEDFTKYLYEEIGGALGYSNTLNATQTAKVMQKYLQDDRDISMTYWSMNMPSKANVVAQLKLDRPVIYCDRWDNPQPSGGTVDHVIVVYGYDSSNHLIAHFGWSNYSHVECTSGAFAFVVILVIIVVVAVRFFPSSPEGYMDVVEVVELSKFSEAELQRKMLGQHRVNINDAWGPPTAVESQPDTDIYEFEDINYQIILEYDSEGCVVSLKRNELNK